MTVHAKRDARKACAGTVQRGDTGLKSRVERDCVRKTGVSRRRRRGRLPDPHRLVVAGTGEHAGARRVPGDVVDGPAIVPGQNL